VPARSARRAALVFIAAAALSGCRTPSRPVLTPADLEATRSPAAQLHADLAAIFTAPQFDRAFWSVLVRRVDADEALFALNENKLMMPGSALKIMTGAVAGEALGWDHQFETRVATVSPVDGGVLRGDLFVIGGGDPSISERGRAPGTLRLLARQLRATGLTRIEGGIVGDDDLFDDRGYGDGWTLDNLPYGYSASVSALEYNEGSVDLVIAAGSAAGDPVGITVRPDGSGLQIDNRLTTVAENAPGALTLQRRPGSLRVVVQGQIPANAQPFVRTASVDNPTKFFVTAFRHALAAEGIEVAGDAVDIDELSQKPAMTDAVTLASHTSPPLRELVASMMHVSQNQYAEILLKVAGGRPKAQEILRAWNVPDGSYVMADGSGLSRYNYVTSGTLVRVLLEMHDHAAHRAVFPGTLAVVGRDGTLAQRLAQTPAAGRVRAKTGTVDNVRAIAGYIETDGGDTLVFAMIANNFTGPTAAVDAAADKAIVRLAGLPRLPR
jgi:D-alanyl-D-alanine carboxypeptidase/D-alanyl-D-alanine-endopeptidase (penicillin-binding protein 4)